MANLGTLIEKVTRRILDDSFTEDEITEYLNEGLNVVSGAVKLPELDAVGEVTTATDAISVPLPENYQRGLYRCEVKDTGKKVTVLNNKGQLAVYSHGLKNEGDVSHVAVVGRELFYQAQPSVATTLVLHYYRKPTPLAAEDDEPSCLPVHYHNRLLESYACGEIFELIEDGLEGGTPNTDRQQKKFWALVGELKKELKEGVSNPPPPLTKVNF